MIIKHTVKFLLWFLGTIYLVFLISQQAHFLISETDSLPYHYFLHFPKIKPSINNYTVVYSNWYKGLIIKKIIGIKDSKIWYHKDDELFVNDLKIGIAKQVAIDGRLLHPIKAQIIPEEQVFLYSEHERSFDSRYQELGLVSINQLQGLVVPII